MNGVALFAISYDSVEILRNFAATHGITYPLLSDEGSHAMRGLGLINDRVQEDHAVYGIQPNEAATIAAATFGIVAIAALSGYLPARRATQVDPVTAIRCE